MEEKKDFQYKVIEDQVSVISQEELYREQAWYELQNAYATKKPLTGTLSGVEDEKDNGVVVLYYKEYRILIPYDEMELKLAVHESDTEKTLRTRRRIALRYMMGCEMDFLIMGIDKESRSIVASRKRAMAHKRHYYYFDNETGKAKIAPQDVVEARVIAVGEKVIRVEVFGVECAIPAKEICWDWLGDARERYNVGDRVKVLITEIKTDPEKETVFIKASLKKLIRNDSLERLTRCKVQSTYTGRITDIVNGIIRVDLDIGAKAIAYHCADRRFPGKNDRVTMVVHRLDRSKCVAVGIITKIVRQCI